MKELKYFIKGIGILLLSTAGLNILGATVLNLSWLVLVPFSILYSIFGFGYVVYRTIRQVGKRFERDPGAQHVHDTLRDAGRTLKTMRLNIRKLPGAKQRQLWGLYETTEYIYRLVKEKPSKYSASRKFFNDELPSIEKVVEQYVFLETQPVRTSEMKEQLIRAEELVASIDRSLKKQSVQLLENDLLELTVELDYVDQNFRK
ncbi:MAG: 5-bromo-4-chloroindolyl phosphate hydrolysis family protein [Bacilli bacterium]